MNKQKSDILNVILQYHCRNQRALAERCGFSLGMVNRSVKALQGQGFLTTDMELTEKARLEMAKHRPKNAVILAAGYGMRMVPINMETPKGLFGSRGGTADRAADPSASCGKGEGNLCCRWFLKRNSTIIWLTGMA